MNIFTLESRSDLQKIDSNWENFVAEICNIRQFPMANCLGYGMKMVPKMPGMSFSLFVVNYQVYPHPNLARIWSGTTKTGRTLLHRFVTQEWQVFKDSAQKCVGFSAGSGSAPDPNSVLRAHNSRCLVQVESPARIIVHNYREIWFIRLEFTVGCSILLHAGCPFSVQNRFSANPPRS